MITPTAGTPSRRRTNVIAALVALSSSVALFGLACSDNHAASSSAAAATTSSAAGATSSDAIVITTGKSADDDKLLFPQDGSQPEPLALRFCQAMHDLATRKQGECCGEPGASGHFTAECARTLSISLRSKAVTLDAAAVDKCAEAYDKELQGCGWVGPSSPLLPEECSGIIRGQVAEGATCRSSLECADGQRCQGLTATRAGRCGAPKAAGIVCGGATDSLAAFTRQNALESTHPECAGYCARTNCKDGVAIGGACTVSEECGPKNACVGGKCSADGFPKAGQACVEDRCARGVRCVKSKCIAPKAEGEACEADIECLAACDKPEGAAAGKCAKRCPVARIPTKNAFTVKPVAPAAPPKR